METASDHSTPTDVSHASEPTVVTADSQDRPSQPENRIVTRKLPVKANQEPPGKQPSGDETLSAVKPSAPEQDPNKELNGHAPEKAISSDTKNLSSDLARVRAMLVKPTLADGESSDDFKALERMVTEACAPKNLFDYLRVADITHDVFEEHRYRRQMNDLAGASRFKALVALLISITPNFEMKAAALAIDYYGPDPKLREAAKDLSYTLRHYGRRDYRSGVCAAR